MDLYNALRVALFEPDELRRTQLIKFYVRDC